MTKGKSRKNVLNSKKKSKIVDATNAADNHGVVEHPDEVEKTPDVVEEKAVNHNKVKDEKKQLLNNKERENASKLNVKYFWEKFRKVFLMEDTKVATTYARVLLLFVVIFLTFVTRFYNLQNPKHIW